MDILWLSEKEVDRLLTVEAAMPLVEEAFGHLARGDAQMPPKLYLEFTEYGGDLRAMPAYIPKISCAGNRPFAGVKVVNSHPGNPKRGLPTVSAIYILNDPETGMPLAVMAAGRLTDVRTGAGGGVAAKYLARKESSILGLVGAGRQAATQFTALATLFPLREVLVAAQSLEEAQSFCTRHARSGGPVLRPVTVQEACGADIVVTTTPGRDVVVKSDWIREGTHINAIGADAPGKQELDVEILKRARVIVDSPEQALHSGEINMGIEAGTITVRNIAASLGEIVTGKKPGRQSDRDITVFDSTGLAIQDVAVAGCVYQRALQLKRGITLEL
ncbi:MAG: alanine dehydrogenase [Elusimicrobia bacterium]|jgi:alanine dehydrogenase|nr:alanine dehydrogenase [Elusimicrobiota bacterium]